MSWKVLMEMANTDVHMEEGGRNISSERNESEIGLFEGKAFTLPSEMGAALLSELKLEDRWIKSSPICVVYFWVH